MHVAVPCETAPAERRVALVPGAVGKLVAAGVAVSIETGAGAGALHPDAAYREAGAGIVASAAEAFAVGDFVCKVQAPSLDEAKALREGCLTLSLFQPAADLDVTAALRDRGIGS